MTPPAALSRLRTVVPHAFPWFIGVLVVLLRRGPLELVPPAQCQGAFELVIAGAAIVLPDVSTGALLEISTVAARVAATAMFVNLATRLTNRPAIAASVGLALGLGPLFQDALAPPWEATAVLFAALAGLVIWRGLASASRSYRLAVAIGALALAAALFQPGWVFPAAAFGGLGLAATWPRRDARTRWAVAAGGAAAILLVGITWLFAFPPDPLAADRSMGAISRCVTPGGTRVVEWLRGLGPLLGPVPLALAALGAFGAFETGRRNLGAAVALVVIALVSTGAGTDSRVALAPVLVALWILAVLGLRIVAAALGSGIPARVMLAVVLVCLPALQTSRRVNDERDNQIRPIGHETVTLRQIHAMLNVVPPDAALANEDASIGVLLRASAVSGRRSRKPFVVVPRRRDDVATALGMRPVYAFALGQRELRDRGIEIQPVEASWRHSDGTITRYDGLAAVVGVRPCRTVEETWVDVSDESAGGRMALVADSESARGPIRLFLGGMSASDPAADGWSARALRGFHRRVFAQPSDRPQPPVIAEANSVGLPTDSAVLQTYAVVSMRLHRVPNAPLALPVVLGAPYPRGVARRDPGATPGRIRLCNVAATPVTSFAVK